MIMTQRYDSFKDRWIIEKDGRFFASFLNKQDCDEVFGLIGFK